MNRCRIITCVIFAGVEVSTQRMMCRNKCSGWRREGLGLCDQAAAKMQYKKKEQMRSGYDMREWLHGGGVVLKIIASLQLSSSKIRVSEIMATSNQQVAADS